MIIERDCLELTEVAEQWQLRPPEIRFLVGNGSLKLSVRLVSQLVELYYWEYSDRDDCFRVPLGRECLSVVADLSSRDAFALVRTGKALVREVELPDETFAEIAHDDGLHLYMTDALVRCENVEKLKQYRATTGQDAAQTEFDFRCFDYKGERYTFTAMQAKALQFMKESHAAGKAERHYGEILKAADSSSPKPGHLFSRQPKWKNLLRCVRRGYYELDPDFAAWMSSADR